MWVGERRVGTRPIIGARAFVEHTLSKSIPACVPISLICCPIRYARRAGCWSIGKNANPHSAGIGIASRIAGRRAVEWGRWTRLFHWSGKTAALPVVSVVIAVSNGLFSVVEHLLREGADWKGIIPFNRLDQGPRGLEPPVSVCSRRCNCLAPSRLDPCKQLPE